MVSKASECLAGDHVALDRLLKQLQATLNNGDVNACYASLDLFWAKWRCTFAPNIFISAQWY